MRVVPDGVIVFVENVQLSEVATEGIVEELQTLWLVDVQTVEGW